MAVPIRAADGDEQRSLGDPPAVVGYERDRARQRAATIDEQPGSLESRCDRVERNGHVVRNGRFWAIRGTAADGRARPAEPLYQRPAAWRWTDARCHVRRIPHGSPPCATSAPRREWSYRECRGRLAERPRSSAWALPVDRTARAPPFWGPR